MGEIKPILFASGAVLFVAQVFIIVGVATPRWLVGDDFNDGLFERCNTTSNTCGDPSESGFWFTGRSLLVESCIGVFLAILVLVLFMVMVHKDSLERYRKCCSYSFPQSVLSSSIFAAAFIAIALILIDVDAFDYNNYSPKPKLGYSFYLAMVACILTPIGGVLAFLGKTPKPKVETTSDDDTGVQVTVVDAENGGTALKENPGNN